MTVEHLRECVRRQPFETFAIHLNDGREIAVSHPDYISLPPDNRATTIIVWGNNDTFQFVSVRNIASVESRGQAPAFPQRPKSEFDSGD